MLDLIYANKYKRFVSGIGVVMKKITREDIEKYPPHYLLSYCYYKTSFLSDSEYKIDYIYRHDPARGMLAPVPFVLGVNDEVIDAEYYPSCPDADWGSKARVSYLIRRNFMYRECEMLKLMGMLREFFEG